MPLNTFPVDPAPEFPVEITPNYETNEVKFGDGYKVTSPNGINAKTLTISLSYVGLIEREKNVVESFLNLHAPSTPFYLPAIFAGVMGAYTCKDWSLSRTDPGLFSMNVTLEQFHGA